MYRRATLHALGWNEPLAAVGHEHEQVFEPVQVEGLDQAAPASVTAACANRYRPALFVTARRRLYLHARELAIEVGDQVVVSAVAEGDRNVRTLSHEPAESGAFAEITLFARRKHPVGEDGARGNSPP
jgi:hypothetical protein